MIDIEVRGIPCVFNDGALDDFEMLEKIEQMESGNITALVSFAKGIFGEEQLGNIKSQLRDADGVCRLTEMNDFISECMNEVARIRRGEVKTSLPCLLA